MDMKSTTVLYWVKFLMNTAHSNSAEQVVSGSVRQTGLGIRLVKSENQQMSSPVLAGRITFDANDPAETQSARRKGVWSIE
jgi:hypothetical protein